MEGEIDRLSYELEDVNSNLHIVREYLEREEGGRTISQGLFLLERELLRIVREMRDIDKKEA